MLATLMLPMAGNVSAQHLNSWNRATLTVPIAPKWSTGAEVQCRRQNGLDSDNPFQYNLLYSYRHWVNYQAGKNVRIMVSPFAWLRSYKAINNTGDYTAAPGDEYRFTLAAEWKYAKPGAYQLMLRPAVEYRDYVGKENEMRYRLRQTVRRKVNTLITLQAYAELFYTGKTKSTFQYYDQSRYALSAYWQITKGFNVETGYMYCSRQNISSHKTQSEHDLVINMIYQLPGKSHSIKKPQS